MNIRKNYNTHLAISGAIAVIGLCVADRYASLATEGSIGFNTPPLAAQEPGG